MSHDQSREEPSAGPGVTVNVEHRGDDVVLHVRGELDLCTTAILTAAIETAVRAEPSVMVIDLSGVGFLASCGLEALLVAHQSTDKISLRVVATSRATLRPLKVSGLIENLNVYESLTAALPADRTADSRQNENA